MRNIDTTEDNIPSNQIFEKVPSTAAIAYYMVSTEYADLEITTEWFEWASELLKAGYINAHIIALSHKKTDDQIKSIGLINVIFDELNIDLDDTFTIYKYYGIYILKQGLTLNKEVYEILSQLNQLFLNTYYYLLYDFHVLYVAYTELREEGEQSLWKGMDLKNKEEYVRAYFDKWLKKPDSKIYNKWEQKSSFRKRLEQICRNKYASIVYFIFIIVFFIGFYWMIYKLFSNSIISILIVASFTCVLVINAIFEIIKVRNKAKNNKS